MAKEDFCFTYYDGDAARDTTHMNRLERGAYHDIILCQRKFGRLTKDQIRKVLGKDFEECWPAIELILKTDGEKFFIEWLDKSIDKMRKHSTKQKENITKRYQTSTTHIPKEEMEIPLEDGDGNGNGDVIENRLKGAFDEIYLDQEKIKWPHIDFEFEYYAFCNKVRGSPEKYISHDVGAMRLALQSQLRHAKPKIKMKQNGISEENMKKFDAL